MPEEIEMTPVAPDPVANALPVHAAGRARQLFRIAGELEIDPPFDGVEVDLGHFPRRSLGRFGETVAGHKLPVAVSFDLNTVGDQLS